MQIPTTIGKHSDANPYLSTPVLLSRSLDSKNEWVFEWGGFPQWVRKGITRDNFGHAYVVFQGLGRSSELHRPIYKSEEGRDVLVRFEPVQQAPQFIEWDAVPQRHGSLG